MRTIGDLSATGYSALAKKVREGKASEGEKTQLGTLAKLSRWGNPGVQEAQDALAADAARD